jgi:hypothetical protein
MVEDPKGLKSKLVHCKAIQDLKGMIDGVYKYDLIKRNVDTSAPIAQ